MYIHSPPPTSVIALSKSETIVERDQEVETLYARWSNSGVALSQNGYGAKRRVSLHSRLTIRRMCLSMVHRLSMDMGSDLYIYPYLVHSLLLRFVPTCACLAGATLFAVVCPWHIDFHSDVFLNAFALLERPFSHLLVFGTQTSNNVCFYMSKTRDFSVSPTRFVSTCVCLAGATL